MSTVTLSKPHCAITSAENPEGIASHAFTTALPEAQTFFTLFATLFPSLCPCRHCEERNDEAIHSFFGSQGLLRCARNDGANQAVARCILTSLTPTSRAVFTIAAQVSSGKGTPFLVRSARIFLSVSPGIKTASTPATGLVALIKST